MILILPNSKTYEKLKDGDSISLTRKNSVVCRGKIMAKLASLILINLDMDESRKMTEIYGDSLPKDIQILVF